ncbi:serine protease inhibitor Cvsi-2-like [Mercenaria mercenaria]|uniref:serine protease inhibitor Cvsi-2-like n=1 Tax=Mercenaria mercenaria TaxID=6596 RepID=UPI001E1D5745|nr:serine protease inhibitor Cvsi-2-like [Mercenaria mercenaria]
MTDSNIKASVLTNLYSSYLTFHIRIKMKVLLLICAALCVVYIHGEDCPTNNVNQECTHVNCDGNFHKECVQNVCTCTANTDHSCTAQSDCTSGHGDCHRQSGWHCVDNRCRCGGFFG